MNFHSDLRVLILGVLETSGPAHGYEIAQCIAVAADSVGGYMHPKAAQLYPILHRLEREGLVEARWKAQARGQEGIPPRRVYELTVRGRRELEENRADWGRFAASVCLLIGVQHKA